MKKDRKEINMYRSYHRNRNYANHSSNFYVRNPYRTYPVSDYGPEPFVVNIAQATTENKAFRTALWTGDHLQLTLMSIPVGGEIGVEMHPDVDQFIRIEEGQALVKIGDSEDNLMWQRKVGDDYAIFIPAGTWHNIINLGGCPLKLYSIYAPPQHPRGTVQLTKEDAEAEENGY